MRSRDAPETSIYLFIYYLSFIYHFASSCKKVSIRYLCFFFHGFVIQVLSSFPFLPPPPLPSGCLVTVILIENEQVIKQADDFIVVSNTHHDNYKVSLVIITEAPYNRMFANENQHLEWFSLCLIEACLINLGGRPRNFLSVWMS